MNRLLAGYTSRGDGTYEKRIVFSTPCFDLVERETLVRSRTGRLLRVERGKPHPRP